jgi:hypothetical protein
MDPITTTLGATAAKSALPAVAAPSILGGGLTGAGMMTSSQLPGLMVSSTPGLMGALGTGALNSITSNPFPAANLGLGIYDRMNQSQAPLQPSPALSAQQLIGQQMPSQVPQFNSMLQLPRRPILIG